MNLLVGFNPFDIYGSLLQLIWTIFIQGPLYLISVFSKVLTYITGGIVTDLFFGTSNNFSFSNIPNGFWWFVAIAVGIFVIVFVTQIIVIQFQDHTENKSKLIKALYAGIRAFIFMFLIPIFFFIANFCLSEISKLISSGFSGNGSVADYLWHLGDPNWNGDPGGVPSNFGPPDNIKSYNFIAEIFGTWFMFYAVVVIGLVVVQKVIELFFLFIVSPIVMVTMVCDDGKRVFVWKDMVIAKFLASTSVLIGFNLFMMAVSGLMKVAINSIPNFAERQLFIVLFLCGGALSLLGFSNIIAALVGESVGITESMQSMQGVMSGLAFTAGGAKMVGKALGFARTERNKRKMGHSAGAMNFAQEYAGTNRVMDNGKEGIRMPDNWTRRGIPGLAFAAIGTGVALGTAIHVAGKTTALGKKNWFTKSCNYVGGAISKPVVNSSKAVGQFIKKETNPGLINSTKDRHEKHTDQLGELYEKKVKNINNKINNLPKRITHEDYRTKSIENKERKVIKWNNKINKYNKKAENLENFLNKKKSNK